MDTEKLTTILDKLKGDNKKNEESLLTAHREALDEMRELSNQLSDLGGNIRKDSKKIINALVKESDVDVRSLIKNTHSDIKKFQILYESVVKKLQNHLGKETLNFADRKNIGLKSIDSDWNNAKEEYLEARHLKSFLDNKSIFYPRLKTLQSVSLIIGSLSDFIGELSRKAKFRSIKENDNEKTCKRIESYLKIANEIQEVLSRYSFSNKGNVRQKIDQLDSHIARMETTLYRVKTENNN